jgi:H+-transporting ATPase
MDHHIDDIDELVSHIDDGSTEPFLRSAQNRETLTDITTRGKLVSERYLHTDPQRGLSEVEAARRRKLYGVNEISEKREPNFVRKILVYFSGPVQFVMIGVAILAAALQKWIELGVILALLCLNATVGYIQEFKAGNVVSELRKSVASKTIVVRNGSQIEIPAIQVVPGDIVPLDEGSIVPADGRLIDDGYIQVDQSPLTGESLPQEKRCNDEVFSTSVVKRGEATMIVTSIGDDTYVGVTASLVSRTEKEGHFQKILSQVAMILLVLVAICIFVIWISGFFRSLSIITLLVYTLIVTVIGVPVGLPAVVTTTMAVGAAELARKKVVVQKLSAIESLAGVDILCTDKTGTLTQNRLTMGEPYVASGVSIDDLLLTSVLASSRKLKGLDPIDRTVILTLKHYPSIKNHMKRFRTTKFQPFDPVGKKVISTVHVVDTGDEYVCVKGAPASVLSMVKEKTDGTSNQLRSDVIYEYNQKVEDFASRGFRSLGVARKEPDGNWKLLGILQMFDPPRLDTMKTIEEAKELGLSIKMLTGDAVGIAKETCRQLNMGNNIFSIKRLMYPNTTCLRMTGSQFNDFVEAADGFAEVFPQHKYMVVDILQKRGHLVAMTGDGMNDAPSLKKADAGIAVEGSSEAARSAADIVFLSAGLSTIIDALKTSRMIFHRMRAYVVYRIALSIHLELFLVTTIVILNTSIDATLVVFLAIFADIATLAIAYDNATYSMRPTQWNLPNLWGNSITLGLVLAIGTWLVYATTFFGSGRGIISRYGSSQEILFLQISLTQNWLIFITRCDGPFWRSMPSWQLILAVIVVDVVATLVASFGWFGNPVDIITIVKVWIVSLGIFTILALLHGMLNTSDIFNIMLRSKPVDKFEDLMYNLERVATLHEKNHDLRHDNTAPKRSNGDTLLCEPEIRVVK